MADHIPSRTARNDQAQTERVNQPGREEGLVRLDEQPLHSERPEEWGWHGEIGPKGRVLAVIPILFMLAYLNGNHRGRVEDVWILGITGLMILIVIWDYRRRRNLWRGR